ncbi:hypothetical protein QBC40DRAFT_301316 [Triangularia verruculosa]|uniref:2EXR domain-containing protein n=1 Tax=Triangularia verruculosa TaxID=2587418 RepID=A0AAN6X7V7_9PEZI|nr:hypothetical protein QBC40DRAFT_301316 [Triangularia verruculosa]
MSSKLPGCPTAALERKTDFEGLPTELRLQIYRDTWTRRILVANLGRADKDLGAIGLIEAPPVALFINFEAREETLRHYHKYTVVRGPDQPDKQGYINPDFDVLHIDIPSPRFSYAQDFISIPTLAKPSLRVAISRDTHHMNLLPLLQQIPELIRGIKTIDFWSTIQTPRQVGPQAAAQDGPDKVTSRYRIARMPASAPLTSLARWTEAVVYPAPRYPSTICPQAGNCKSPDWYWKQDYAATRWINRPADLGNTLETSHGTVTPIPGDSTASMAIRYICAAKKPENESRHAFERHGVLLFDSEPRAAIGKTPPRHDTWALLKVVDPHRPCLKSLYTMLYKHLRLSRPVATQASVELTKAMAVAAKLTEKSGTQYSPDNVIDWNDWNPLHHIDNRVTDVVDGICRPEWGYVKDGGQTLSRAGNNTVDGYPAVSEDSVSEGGVFVSEVFRQGVYLHGFSIKATDFNAWRTICHSCEGTGEDFITSVVPDD